MEAPCCETNPELWRRFCAATGRDPVPSITPVWTEVDVANWFASHVREAVRHVR